MASMAGLGVGDGKPMSKWKITRTADLQGRELLKRLRARFPVLFPAGFGHLKPWAVGEAVRTRQALAAAEDGETVASQVWRAAINVWFHGNIERRVAYLKCLSAGAPRYDMHGNVSGTVSEEEAAHAAGKLAEGQAQLAKLKTGTKVTKGSEAAAAAKSGGNNLEPPGAVGGDAGQGKENLMTTDGEDLAVRIWRQVEHGVDVDLLPTREKRAKDLAKKLDRELDHNGWRMFVSGCVYTMANGKGLQRRNAEVMLVETVRRWRDQVVDLLPERAADLRRIVEAGIDRPEPPPRKDG